MGGTWRVPMTLMYWRARNGMKVKEMESQEAYIHTYIHKEYLYSAKEQKSHNAPRSQLQASPNKYVFSFCLKTGNVRFGRRRSTGSSFHNRGPAAVKLLSPNRLCVAGTDSIRMSLELERSGRRPISDSWRQSSARYTGATPASDWWTRPAILKIIRWRTGSQCSCCSTGVMWSHLRAPVTRRAAAFWQAKWIRNCFHRQGGAYQN